MKIIGLHIYGFGKLSNFTINNLEEMRVFFGDNEAGKTTIQQFILTMLFGFKKEKMNDPNYTPILSSKYGGKLFIEEDRYHIRMIERVKGVNKGEAIVVSQEGKEYGEEVLKRLLNGLDRDMYEKVYSFNVFDLQELHSFDGLELNRFFFSTSLAGTKDFFHLEKEVEKKKANLFKKSGKNPVINQLLLELRSLEKDLSILKGKNDKYIHHLEEKEMLEESIRHSETEYGDQQHLLNRLQELQRIRPLYMEKKKLSYEQNQLEGSKNFPFGGASRLEKLLIECEELTISFQHLEKKREELETSPIIGLSSKQATLIHQYLNEETTLKQLNNKIEQLKIEIENEMKDVTSLQDHLGMQNVTYDEVEKMNTNLALQNDWNGWVNERHQFILSIHTVEDALKREQDELSRLEKEIELTEEKMWDESEYQELVNILDTLPKNKDLADMRNPFSYRNWLLLACSFVLFICAVPLYFLINFVGILTAVVGGFGTLLSFVLLYQGVKKQNKWFEASLKNENALVRVGQRELYRSEARGLVTEQQTLRSEWKHTLHMVEHQEERVRAHSKEIKEKQEGLQRLEDDFAQLKQELRLPSSLQWELLQDAVNKIVKLKEMISRKRRSEQSIHRLTDDFQSSVLYWKKQFLSAGLEYSSWNSFDYIKQKLNEYETEKHKMNWRSQQIAELKDEMEKIQLRLESMENERDMLLQQAEVNTNEDYFMKAMNHERYHQLEKEIELVAYKMDTLTEEEEELLQNNRIEQRMEQCSSLMKELKEQQKQLRDKAAKLDYSLKQLEEGYDFKQLLQTYHNKKAELIQQSEDWAAYAIVLAALEQLQSMYKEKELPEILGLASSNMMYLTNNHYQEIRLDEDRWYVLRGNDSIPIQHLSQGTKEQVYVSIRLALICSLRESGSLPIIVDDGFVHFDHDRSQRVIHLLKDISKDVQVIFFTCHPHFKEKFNEEEVVWMKARTEERSFPFLS